MSGSRLGDPGHSYGLFVAASSLDHPASTTVKIGGNREQLVASARVMGVTQELTTALTNPDISLHDVMGCIDRKNAAATEFLRVTGSRWPL